MASVMVPVVIEFLFDEDDDVLPNVIFILLLYVTTIQLQVNKTATSKRLPVLPAKPAPESVSKINPGFAKPA